ncbi:hypothetical protein BST61_g7768 [Cercospora zeina]
MFSNARPVPSKAALKVLHQLAYISSGTAVGIATLCAEERRRRTQVVQKIADNAKRIKQSPQHIRNKRRRSADEIQEKQAIAAREDDVGAAIEPDERAARAMELPSVVENGYAQLVQNGGQRHPRLRRSSKERMHENLEEHADRTTSIASRMNQNASRVRSVQSKRRFCLIRPISCGASSIGKPTETQRTSRKINTELEQPNTHGGRREGLHQPTSAPQLRLMQHQLASIDHTLDIADTVAKYVTMFYRQILPACGTGKQVQAMAISLLRLSTRAGLHKEAFQLLGWLATFDALSSELILLICQSCRQFLQRSLHHPPTNQFDVLLFYRRVFVLPIFTQQADALRVRAQLAVIEGIASVYGRTAGNQTQIRKTSIDLLDNELLVRELTQRCEELCANDDHELALNLLFIVLEYITLSADSATQYEELSSRCIGSAISKGKLELCVRHWVLGARFSHDRKQRLTFLDHRLNQITELAVQTRSHDALFPICGYLARAGDVRDAALEIITEPCRAALAMACAVMDQPPIALLEALRIGLSLPRKNELVLAHADARLKQVWQSTRSLSAVLAAYKELREDRIGLSAEQLEFDTILPPEQALIEICSLAGQPDRGLELLSRTHTRLEPIDAFSLAALTLATKHSWGEFESLVSAAADSRLSIASDSIATRRLNHAVFKYGERHSAVETWNFVSGLVSRVGLVPNASTAKNMLQKLVSTFTPVSMFRSHYRAVRTPHVLLMHFGRRLLRTVPFLKSAGLQGVVKEAIAYDMRVKDTYLDRQEAVQLAAEINLKRLMESSDFIPFPIGSKGLRSAKAREDYLALQAEQNAYEHPPRDAMHPFSEGTVRLEPVAVTSPGMSKNALPETESADSMAEDNADLADSMAEDNADLADSMAEDNADLANEPFGKLLEEYYAAEDLDTQTNPSSEEAVPSARDARSADRESHSAELTPLPLGNFEQRRRRDSKQDEDRVPSREVTSSEEQRIGYAGHDSKVVVRQLVTNMVLAFSMRKWKEVLDLYERSLGPTRRPPSPLVLNVAVQARIRLDGGEVDEAKRIMSAAQDAGFNASCALAPILIRDMRMMPREDKRQLSRLRDKVMDYYYTNKKNGWPVSHYVGVTAANLLIDNHEPALGIDLLNFICDDRWGSHDPPDIVAMTVFLKGFIDLRHLKGIIWVVRKVLTQKMPIDHKFLARLKQSPRAFDTHPHLPEAQRKSVGLGTYNRLKLLRRLCGARRVIQRWNAFRMGYKFIAVLRSAARFQLASSEEERQYLVNFERNYHNNRRLPNEASAGVNQRVPETYMARRARSRRACISRPSFRQSWLRLCLGQRRKKKTKTTSIAANRSLRARQYRQYIRATCTTPGGKRYSFRQYLALNNGNGMFRQDSPDNPAPKPIPTRAWLADAADYKFLEELTGESSDESQSEGNVQRYPPSNPSSQTSYNPLLYADTEDMSPWAMKIYHSALRIRGESQRVSSGSAPRGKVRQDLPNSSYKPAYTPLLQGDTDQTLKQENGSSAPSRTRDDFQLKDTRLSTEPAPRSQVRQNPSGNASSKAAYTPLLQKDMDRPLKQNDAFTTPFRRVYASQSEAWTVDRNRSSVQGREGNEASSKAADMPWKQHGDGISAPRDGETSGSAKSLQFRKYLIGD